MVVKIENPDPQSNLIEFKPSKRTGTLEPKRRNYDSCKHARVFVDEGSRVVTCRDCPAVLDAFMVLLEMAQKQRRWLEELDEWDERRESELAERYDREWMRELALGRITEPPADPATRKIWDGFHAVLGDKFSGIYKRKGRLRTGPEWYGTTVGGGRYSYEYVRKSLLPKTGPTGINGGDFGSKPPGGD